MTHSISVPRDIHKAQDVLAAVRVCDASKQYGAGANAVYALRSVSVEFAPGTFTAVMGPSGSGKSTLLHCAAGLDTLTEGTVFLRTTELSRLGEQQRTLLRRTQVGFIFQAFNLLPMLDVAENITLPLLLAGKRPDQVWFNQLVDTLGLRQRLHHLPAELSGGQQQRTAIARALMTRPTVIFADEPTGNLDSQAGSAVLSFLRQAVRDFRQTIIMVTHDPFAAAYADRVVFFADGQIVDTLIAPTTEHIIQRMQRLGGR